MYWVIACNTCNFVLVGTSTLHTSHDHATVRGESCLYQWVEHLREALDQTGPADAAPAGAAPADAGPVSAVAAQRVPLTAELRATATRRMGRMGRHLVNLSLMTCHGVLWTSFQGILCGCVCVCVEVVGCEAASTRGESFCAPRWDPPWRRPALRSGARASLPRARKG